MRLMLILLIALSSCAPPPPDYHYGLGGFLDVQPDDTCTTLVNNAGAVTWLNSIAGRPEGPTSAVVAIQKSSPLGAGISGTNHLSCHMTVLLSGGAHESGTADLTDPGGSLPLEVSWSKDAPRVIHRYASDNTPSVNAQFTRATAPFCGPSHSGFECPQRYEDAKVCMGLAFNSIATLDFARNAAGGERPNVAARAAAEYTKVPIAVAQAAIGAPASMSPEAFSNRVMKACLESLSPT